jgi:hypothetical protein
MELVSIITHENKKIVFLNAKDIKDENELCINISKMADIAIKNNINRLLFDVTGTFLTPKIKETAAKGAELDKKALGQVYSALVGLSPMQRIIANVISRGQYFATNIEDAKKWLVSKQ